MIFSKESALQQVNSLLQIYDKLHIEKESNQEIILTGEILVNRTASSYTLYKTYHIEVHIPFESDKLPYVVSWMQEFVEPYFFSYEYYQRFGCFPFGERSHGIEGILQSFGDVFQETDNIKVCKILMFIYSDRYRDHLPCPCGSGKKYKNCCGK